MALGLNLYFKRYVSPHAKQILLSPQVPLSAAVALLVIAHEGSMAGYLTVDVTGVFVNYNFMVFGFTIAALTIVFAVPSQKFISFLVDAGQKVPSIVTDPWEKALFIMSWNGFVHFCALISSLATLIIAFDYGYDLKPFVYDIGGDFTRIVFFGAAWLQAYALLQFLSSLLSVYFFCAVFANFTRRTVTAPQAGDK